MITGSINKNKSLSGSITTPMGTTRHDKLSNRDKADQHPIEAITDLRETLDNQSGLIEEEIARATEEEIRIDDKLDTEISNRVTDVDAEEARATAAETALDQAIGTEINDRMQADVTLQTNINTEASTRQDADTTLQGNIDGEKTRAEGEEDRLENKIDNKVFAEVEESEVLVITIN